MTTTTHPYVTADDERRAADVDHILVSVAAIVEGLAPLVLDAVWQLRAIDRDVEPRRQLTVDSDFGEDFDETKYLTAHRRLDGLNDQLVGITRDIGRIRLGELDDEDAR